MIGYESRCKSLSFFHLLIFKRKKNINTFFILQLLVLIRFVNVTRFAFVEFCKNMIYWSTKSMQIYEFLASQPVESHLKF